VAVGDGVLCIIVPHAAWTLNAGWKLTQLSVRCHFVRACCRVSGCRGPAGSSVICRERATAVRVGMSHSQRWCAYGGCQGIYLGCLLDVS
jgi:hypothetical protein